MGNQPSEFEGRLYRFEEYLERRAEMVKQEVDSCFESEDTITAFILQGKYVAILEALQEFRESFEGELRHHGGET